MKINYRKIFKYVRNTIIGIVILIILLILSLQIPAVQNFVKDKLVNYLEEKIQTKVSLEKVYIGFPNTLVIKNFYLEGQEIDTLLYVRDFEVGLDMLQLINNKVDLTSIDLDGIRANVVRKQDGKFNFDYIIEAFATNEEEQEKESKPFIISLDKIKLKDIGISFIDQQAANHIQIQFKEFDTRVKKFDLENNDYAIDKIFLDGLKLKLKQNLVREVAQNVEENVDSLNNQTPMKIDLNEIKLTNFNIDYGDDNTKMYAKLIFKNFDISIDKIDLENNSYAINAINLDGLDLNFSQKLTEKIENKISDSTVTETSSNSPPFQLALNEINITKSKIDYGDENSKTFAQLSLNKFQTKINELDLVNNTYNIEEIILKEAEIAANLHLPSNENQTETSEETEETSAPLHLLLGNLEIDDVKTVYNNTAIAPTARGMDFNHLNFSKLNIQLEDFEMKDGTFSGNIEKAEIQEAKGLDIQKLETEFLYANQNAYLKDLILETPNTLIRDNIELKYESMDVLTENPGEIVVNANIRDSKIGFADILNLVPDLRNTTPFDKYPKAILHVDSQIKGKVNDLLIQKLNVSGLGDLRVSASGIVKNAMQPDKLYYDLNVKNVSSSGKIIENLIPKNTLSENIKIPKKFTIKGKAKGGTEVFDTQLSLTSTSGNAKINAKIDMRKEDAETFDVVADLRKLNVGEIISNPDLGTITAKLNAKGTSFNPEKMNAEITGNIMAANYNQYNYQNINLNANVNNGAFEVDLKSKDPNADLDLLASGVFKDENLNEVKLDGEIVKLDVQQLGFYADPMIIAGGIQADFASLDPDNLNGNLTLSHFGFSNKKEVYPIQDIVFSAVSSDESNALKLESQIADIELKGKYKLTQIFGALTQTLNEYYHFYSTQNNEKEGEIAQNEGNKTSQNDSIIIDPHQYFSINATIKNDDLIRKFVPELTSFETIHLDGGYNADTKTIVLNSDIPNLEYGSYSIDQGKIMIVNDEQGVLKYNLSFADLKSESFELKKINLNGEISNNTIFYNLTTKDLEDKIQFLIAGNVKSRDEITEISLDEKGLVLNYDVWEVANGNYIQLKPDGITANNFQLSRNGSEILVQSESEDGNSPLNVTIQNFKIESLTEILKQETLPAAGTLNGTAQLRDFASELKFTTDLTLSDLEVFESPVGNLYIQAETTSPEIISTNIALSGNQNDIKIQGDINTAETSFDLNLMMNRLEMKTLQGFSMNAITETEGYLSGNLGISGTIERLKLLGKLQFNEVGFDIDQTGSKFRNINDAIDFNSRGMVFNRFKINDSDGNSMTINGKVWTWNYQDFSFGLTLDAKDFKLVNSEKSNDAMLYGVLALDTGLEIKGDMHLPIINGFLKVTDDTDFTYVMPQSSPSLQERDGIVEFIDQDQIVLNQTLEPEENELTNRVKGMDVNVNIEVTKEAKTTVVIDKANGDFVEIQGEAELNGGIDPSGKMTMVGVYQVEKGGYEMSVSLLKRRFDIQKGSTITWTGEPTAAQLDLTAVYKTQAAPIDLVEQQITGRSNSEMNTYKQRIPFNALLIIKGELMKPEISFDITMDEENNSISNDVKETTQGKLDQLKNDESEMNKQVFALLLLNRFVGENPFESQSGMTAESVARQSVSRILSEQLNNLAADLIQGVEIDFGLDSQDDYSSGQKNTRTDLNVDVSKRLLNDRLKVTVGSNFGVEGEARENEQTTNIAGNVTLDYSLSKDGRYVLRAYRKDEYQVALQGQIIETGLGFIITLDYDKFKEIFEKKKQNDRRNKREAVQTESN